MPFHPARPPLNERTLTLLPSGLTNVVTSTVSFDCPAATCERNRIISSFISFVVMFSPPFTNLSLLSYPLSHHPTPLTTLSSHNVRRVSSGPCPPRESHCKTSTFNYGNLYRGGSF